MRILYQGLLRSPASWARVGRGYVAALLRLGVDVSAVSPRGFLHDPGFRLPEGLRELTLAQARALPEPEVGLGFLHPPLLDRLLGRRKVNLFVWESDVVPSAWVECLHRGAHRIVVPSSFSRDALIRSGLPADSVGVSPYGHDGPGGAPEDRAAGTSIPPSRGPRRYTVLSIAAPHLRKGVRELCLAYREAFDGDDGVLLCIKSTYDPGASRKRKSFEIPSWDELLSSCGLSRTGIPAVELDLRIVPDEEVLALYRRADLYVQPTWGESFGLALLDAMALGVPCVATGWGGQMDFFPSGDDALPYRLVEAGDALYEPAPGALAAVPDVGALAARLRWHRANAEASRSWGEACRTAVAGLTWLEAGRRLLEVL